MTRRRRIGYAERQLALTRPARSRPRMARLTGTQRVLLAFVKAEGVVFARQVEMNLGYADGAAALRRLARRGLVEHATRADGSRIRDQWRAVRHDERKA